MSIIKDPDALNFREAHAFAKQVRAIGLWAKVRVRRRMFTEGYEVTACNADGTYERRVAHKDSAADFIRIFSQD